MRTTFAALLAMVSFSLFAQDSTYQISIDLRKASNDRLAVSMRTPNVSEDTVEFHLPKIVPGTYSISDFGRFASAVTALDQSGDTLPVRRLDVNRWQISKARKLSQINYLVDDTFDKNENYQENIIFEPGGTSIEANNNVFVLNPF